MSPSLGINDGKSMHFSYRFVQTLNFGGSINDSAVLYAITAFTLKPQRICFLKTIKIVCCCYLLKLLFICVCPVCCCHDSLHKILAI